MFYVVNNAGLQTATWWETPSMDAFYHIMEVNFFGCVRMTKAVVPHMKAKRSGKILQISSIIGFKGNFKTTCHFYLPDECIRLQIQIENTSF